jgi:short-subunit dehydrogenase
VIELDHLVSLHPNQIIGLTGDITDHQTVMQHAQQIQLQQPHLDCLILNAGTAEYVDSNQFDAALFHRVFAINFFANTLVLAHALPLLRQSNIKHIVGISSSAVFTPLSRAEAYGASKAAFSYLLDSLRVDLSHEGFHVSIVYPGFVKTPLTDKNDFPMPMRISADQAAKKIIIGLQKRQQQIVFPWVFCSLLKLLGVLPSGIRNQLMQRFRKENSR